LHPQAAFLACGYENLAFQAGLFQSTDLHYFINKNLTALPAGGGLGGGLKKHVIASEERAKQSPRKLLISPAYFFITYSF